MEMDVGSGIYAKVPVEVDDDNNVTDFEKWQELTRKLQEKDSRFQCFSPYEENVAYFGVSYEDMDENETKKQFKENIHSILSDIIGDLATSIREEDCFSCIIDAINFK